MAKADIKTVDQFRKNATGAAATVVEVKSMQEAMEYAVGLCEKKELRELIPVGDNLPCGSGVPDGETVKVLAAPGLDAKNFKSLSETGKEKGFSVIKKDLRSYLSGTDVGFAVARAGIAETGSCVVESVDEDLRLSTMLCEICVLALKKSSIVAEPHELCNDITELLAKDPMYLAFISGPSKTSDIERVLTLGVHGPLELHVALVED
jgi:L-lactate dehydrogenase complex protein LldG